jgi:hypothetical protein
MGASEILVPDRLFADEAFSAALKTVGGLVQPMASALAEPMAAETRVKRLYGVDTLDGFGVLSGAEISALGLIAAHLEDHPGRAPAGASAAPQGRRGRRHGHRSGHPHQPRDRAHHRRPARGQPARRHRPHHHRAPARACWPRGWPGR